jgi:hypothetical protein
MEIAQLRLKAKNKERKTKLSMETTKPQYFDTVMKALKSDTQRFNKLMRTRTK